MEEKADVIAANILAEIIIRFTKAAYESLKPGGSFIVSGIIRQKQGLVAGSLQETGFAIVETITREDWIAMIARRPTGG
jgi:ribosomal protein L11 methyltransferase